MNNRTLLEVLQDKRVQKLIQIAASVTGCKTEQDIIELVRQKLTGKEGPSSKWKQLEIKM
jgi:hypothetical protein